MKRFTVALAALIIFMCASLAFADQPKVTISAGTGPMSGSLNVAEAKGFFKQNGIDAKVNSYKKGKIAFDKYLSGKDTFATCNIVAIVLTDFDISKHKLIAGLSYTDNQTIILARKSAGIEKPADLTGKRIAIPRASTGHFVFWKFMALHGILPKQVDVVFMNKKEIHKAIVKGEVDAMCTHGMPIEKAKEALGKDWVAFQDGNIHRTSVQLISRTDFISQHQDEVRAVLRGALAGEQFVRDHLVESVEIVAKAKKYSIDVLDPLMRHDIDFEIGLPQSLLFSLETVEQWAIENHLVKRTEPRNYLEFIDYHPLEDVNADKVAILR